MSKELLIAAYETQRMLVLSAFASAPRLVPKEMAFAYEHRLAPVRNAALLREAHGLDPFEDIYPVKGAFMESVIAFVDEKWRAEDFEGMAFERLENHFGGYKANRMEIAHTLHYAFLAGLFDDKVYAAILKSAPMEAHGITRAYGPEDASFE